LGVAGIETLQQLRPFGERRLRKTTPLARYLFMAPTVVF